MTGLAMGTDAPQCCEVFAFAKAAAMIVLMPGTAALARLMRDDGLRDAACPRQAISTAMATASPPPMQSDATPRRPPRA